jgi:hypothetical protein
MKILFATLILASCMSFNTLAEDAPKEIVENIDPKEQVFIQALELSEELIKILRTATDDESSKEVIEKLNALAPKAQALKEKAQENGANLLDKDTKKRLTDKYAERIKKNMLALLGIKKQLQENKEVMAALNGVIGAMN